MSFLIVIYMHFSILTFVNFWLAIFQASATLKRRYPNYHGNSSIIEFILGFLRVTVISFTPIFNILIFWVIVFHTDELIDAMIKKVMEKED